MAMAGSKSTSPFDERDWKNVVKTLPEGADLTLARSELERIKCDKTTPKQRQLECLWLVKQCEPLIYSLDKTGSAEDQVLAKRLRQRAAKAKKDAELYGRMPNDTKFMRQCDIFRLYSRLGGKLGVSTGRNERDQYRRWREPHGPVIDFFRAAHRATIVGKVPKANQVKQIIRRYKKLHFKYGAAHIGGKSESKSKSTFHIDDSKTFIIPAGSKQQ
jgi:hypothetical protein